MWDRLWDFFVDTLMVLFVPLVTAYLSCTSSLFFNVSAKEASGLERVGNVLLIPTQFLFAGTDAVQKSDGSWEFTQKFNYTNAFWPKTISSLISFPFSIVTGSIVKGSAYLFADTRKRHASMQQTVLSREIHSQRAFYAKQGLVPAISEESLRSEGYKRRPGDEHHMAGAKEALREIAQALSSAEIPWWVDCGTLLGTYRYGGIIPWDEDIDIAILLPDFENARRALNQLDPRKYLVQNWSGRDFPNTFMKVYVRKTGEMIDIATYAILPEKKEMGVVFSMEKNLFFMEWWKIRERRFKATIAYDLLFPLKRATFDGIAVFVPNQTVPFLQRYYGEDLTPAKIYDPKTNRFEKDLTHPYWQRAYVH